MSEEEGVVSVPFRGRGTAEQRLCVLSRGGNGGDGGRGGTNSKEATTFPPVEGRKRERERERERELLVNIRNIQTNGWAGDGGTASDRRLRSPSCTFSGSAVTPDQLANDFRSDVD